MVAICLGRLAPCIRHKRVRLDELFPCVKCVALPPEEEDVPLGVAWVLLGLPASQQVALPLSIVLVILNQLCYINFDASPLADTPSLSLQMLSPSVKNDILALLLHLPLPLAIGRGPHRLPLVARHWQRAGSPPSEKTTSTPSLARLRP